MRYLLIEDNADLARSLRAQIAGQGHGVDHAASLSEADDYLASAEYDLILLDITLPDGDGRDFLVNHRKRSQVPVIVMTARSAVNDRVDTLDMGADDYLTKPFDIAELNARCRAVLRRRGGQGSPHTQVGDIVFHPLAATLTVAGETRELRSRELRLFEVLAQAPGRILSKDQLCDRLFSHDEAITDNAIEVYVGRLRRKMTGARTQIETVRGLGYRLVVA